MNLSKTATESLFVYGLILCLFTPYALYAHETPGSGQEYQVAAPQTSEHSSQMDEIVRTGFLAILQGLSEVIDALPTDGDEPNEVKREQLQDTILMLIEALESRG